MSSHSCSIRFSRATASGGWAATSAASSRAALLGGRRRRHAVDQTKPQRLIGTDVREVSNRYLAVARPQSVTRRAGPTGTPSAAPGKRIRRLAPPTRMSQATAISAPAADDVAVADRDRRLREADDAVVDVGEELHATDLFLRVHRLLDVGAGREPHLIGWS